MRRLFVLVLVCLVGCGAPNLAAVDLDPILVQDGDLPVSIVPDQFSSTWEWDAEMPKPIKVANRTLTSGGLRPGVVQVALFTSSTDRDRAYDALVTMIGTPLGGVGERAMSGDDGIRRTAAFTRCHAFVYVELVKDAGVDSGVMSNYLQRLDKRLQAVAC